LQIIREVDTSKVVGNFGVGKIVANLQRYVYWPRMQEYVYRFMKGCMLYCTNKPNNRNQGLHHPFCVPTKPREIISMDFVSSLQRTRGDMIIYWW